MKNYIRLISLAILFIGISFSSCKKDDVKLLATLTAKIDGTDWTSTLRVTTLGSETFNITGTSIGGEILILTIFGSDEGTYNLSLTPPASQCAAVYKASVATSYEDAFVSSNGEVVLTKVDKANQKISGTFKFTVTRLTETKVITEGKFEDLSYEGS